MKPEISWSTLVQEVRCGNPGAQSRMYGLLREQALRVFRAQLPGAEYLEDLAQDAIIWMFANVDEVREPDALPALFHRKCLFLTKDYLRKRNRDRERFTPLDFLSPTGDPEDPDADVLEGTTERIVTLDDMGLTEEQRTLVERHYVEGVPFRMLAEEYSCSEACIRQRLHRVVVRIREQITPYHSNPKQE